MVGNCRQEAAKCRTWRKIGHDYRLASSGKGKKVNPLRRRFTCLNYTATVSFTLLRHHVLSCVMVWPQVTLSLVAQFIYRKANFLLCMIVFAAQVISV